MLSGIKKGKRKRKSDDSSKGKRNESKKPVSTSSSGSKCTNNSNSNAAEELRRMLAGVNSKHHDVKNISKSSDTTNNSNNESIGKSAIERFEQRRGVLTKTSSRDDDAKEETVVLMNLNCGQSKQSPILSKEDFRRGARKGKIKQKESYMHSSADKTISEMVEEEKRSKQQGGKGIDEIFARNVARMGSRYKGNDFKMVAGSTAGADEDDGSSIDMKMFTSASNTGRLTNAEQYNREVSRQMSHSRKQSSVANKCWWWIESETFQKHRLISLGDHLSLVLVPSHLQLVDYQCYLVPLKHSESFASCEDEVWDEVQRFKTSLRSMFKKDGMGVLFCETILPTKALWQAKMDVIPVPLSVEKDAEIFFKSALNEQAEEWGTHTKLLSTKGKGLRQTIPKGFSYFNVEWDDGGFAQIIETNSFPKDFGFDTIAGMMELDPMRFGKKRKASDYDKSAVMNFVKRWKPFDWTVALDGGE